MLGVDSVVAKTLHLTGVDENCTRVPAPSHLDAIVRNAFLTSTWQTLTRSSFAGYNSAVNRKEGNA
jgi:hypothetical protein